jgi:hypothetical protein
MGWVEVTNSYSLAHKAELLLYSLKGCNLARGAICTEKVPGVESGEVLEGSEELITAYSCRNELQVVSNGGVVEKSVGDHFGG